MASLAPARIKREFKEVVTSDEVKEQKGKHNFFSYVLNIHIYVKLSRCKIKLELLNESLSDLRGEIGGPPDTPVSKNL